MDSVDRGDMYNGEKHWEALNPLVRKRLWGMMLGQDGTNVTLTLRRSFRRIEKYKRGRLHRHPLYNGRPVYINVTLVRGDAEDLPLEWEYEFMPCIVDKRRWHKTINPKP